MALTLARLLILTLILTTPLILALSSRQGRRPRRKINNLHVPIALRQRVHVLQYLLIINFNILIVFLVILPKFPHDIVSIKLLVAQIRKPLHDGEEVVYRNASTLCVLRPRVAQLPKGRWAHGTVFGELGVEPVAEHSTRRPDATNLHALAPPSLFAVIHGKGSPAHLAFLRQATRS